MDRLLVSQLRSQDADGFVPRSKYARDIAEFVSFLGNRGKEFTTATASDARDFLDTILFRRYATTTVARKVSELRTTYASCNIMCNPFSQIRVAVKVKPKRLFPELGAETIGLLSRLKVENAKSVRDQAILALTRCDNLQTCQLERLDTSDIDLEAGILEVSSRGHKHRTTYLSPHSIPYLRRWLAVRRRYGTETQAVFISLHWTEGRAVPHQRMSTRSIYQVRATYSKRLSRLAQADRAQN